MKKERFEKAKWIPIFIVAIILMLIYTTIDNITQITSAIGGFLIVMAPLLYGILFAYFLYTPHRKVEQFLKKMKIAFISKYARGFSTIIIFVLLIFVIVFILSFVFPIISSNIISLVNAIPGYITTVMEYFDNLPDDSIWYTLNIANVVRDSSGDFLHTIMNLEGIEQVATGVASFVGGLFSILMGLVISMYILLDRENIADFFKRLNRVVFKREDRANKSIKYISHINKVLFTFIASKGLDSFINFTVATVILLIFGVPYALLLGLIAGVFNFIPYIGSIISAVIISVIALITTDLPTTIPVMILLLVFNQLDGNFIEPRIMKSSLKISPILVILAVVVGGAYFGIVGMFLAVPFTVIIKQLLLEHIASTEAAKAKAAAETEKGEEYEEEDEEDSETEIKIENIETDE